jgi:uncharacterized protein (TIGR04255 family)
MAAEVGSVDRRRLTKAPLALVAFQVNFSDVDRQMLSKAIIGFRKVLNDRDYGELTQVRKNQLTLQLNPLGTAAPTSDLSSSTGWRFAKRNQTWSVTLFQDMLILESHGQAYEEWSTSFRPRLESAIRALCEVFKPELQTRIGLRYINALSHEGAQRATFWRGRIHSAFLGPLGEDALADAFRGSTLRVSFEFEDAMATVNTAFQPDAAFAGRTAVVFDLDIYEQEPKELSVAQVLENADRLNTRALFLFQSIITPSQMDELR